MILITGASGTAGGAVLREAMGTRESVRAMHRNTRDAGASPTGATPVLADFADPASLRDALHGVDSVYLVCGPVPELVELETNVIDACARAEVGHVVLNSALGAGDFPKSFPSWHFQVEQRLKQSGLGHTILRPNGFLQNIAAFNAASIRGTDAFYAAMGAANTSMVDVRDVGAAAASILRDPEPHRGRTYELNGPEAISYHDIAEGLSEALGRNISYVEVPEDTQRQTMLDLGMPPWQVTAILQLQEYYRSERCATVDGVLADLLGRPPGTLDHYLRENAATFDARAD